MFQNKNLSGIGSNLFFKGLDEAIINSIFNSKSFRAEKEGGIVFQAGEESNYLYLILQGEVKLKYSGTKGSESSFRRIKNEFFGEKELLEKTTRITSAVADRDCIFYLLEKEVLFKLLNKHKYLFKNLLFTSDDSVIDEQKLFDSPEEQEIEKKEEQPAEEAKLEEIVVDIDVNDYSAETPDIEQLPDFPAESYLTYSDDESDDLNFNNNGFHPEDDKFEVISAQEIIDNHFLNEDFDNILPPQKVEFFNNDIPVNDEELIPAINDFDHIPEEPQKFEFSPEDSSAGIEKIQDDQQVQTETLTLLESSLKFISNNITFPLNEIKQMTALLSKNSSLTEAQQINDIIQKYIISIQSTVESTLEYAVQKENHTLNRKNVKDVLGNILSLLSKYVESRKVYLYKRIETDAEIEVDELKLYSSFFQLTKNACDSMPEGGNIFVSSVRDGDLIKIEFVDEGTGIPSSLLNEVFEPMFTHGKSDGAGLGLSIARKIIHDHKGDISINGEIGEGTRIIVTLPVCED